MDHSQALKELKSLERLTSKYVASCRGSEDYFSSREAASQRRALNQLYGGVATIITKSHGTKPALSWQGQTIDIFLNGYSENKIWAFDCFRYMTQILNQAISYEKGSSSPAKEGNISELHPEIATKCMLLNKNGHHAEAAEKAFKVVRDRLRSLTGFETGSEAFGKGKLHIRGAVAAHVDKDFNEGVKFLLMSIDFFRNEKAHSSDAKIDDPKRAGEYLSMCSLAMNLLDQAKIT